MGCNSSVHPIEPGARHSGPDLTLMAKGAASKTNGPVTSMAHPNTVWTKETADKLQESVDHIFGTTGRSLLGLEFSFTIADPTLDGCPLIGCSTGFTKLCGYELDDIVGRNCRFLVEPVPADLIDQKARRRTKEFCTAVAQNQEYVTPASDHEPWMPQGRPKDELVVMQKNARKDGSLFNNMFYMKVVNLSSEMGRERPYLIALQSELPEGKEDLSKVAENLEQLHAKMEKVSRELASSFYMQCSVSRQLHTTPPQDGLQDAHTPVNLHAGFATGEIQPWDEGRFKRVRTLAAATRNKGMVHLMKDLQSDTLVAVKQMPNGWIQSCHEEFLRAHPKETEMPWQDIGCTRFLNSVNYRFACNLHGVYRSNEHTFVVSTFEPKGDVFTICQAGENPGPKRESSLVQLVFELCAAVKHLHDMQIVHRDISLENVLQSTGQDGNLTVKLIDFGMATTQRTFQNCARGKASYQAPEMHEKAKFDAFLSDTFAVGVVVYSLLLKDYPWMSTKPGCDKYFEYFKLNGFRSMAQNRPARGTGKLQSECISGSLMLLLEGLLMTDPTKRLTLGEKDWTNRKSVWDEPWLRTAAGRNGWVSL